MHFRIYGPFELPHKSKDWIGDSKEQKNEFKDILSKVDNELPNACGCYLFALRAGKGYKPWYVGLAARQSLYQEIFKSQKIKIFNEVYSTVKKGNPVVFLIAAVTDRDKIASPSKGKSKIFSFLENILIGVALNKNPKLMNIKKTQFLKNTVVPQLLNTPQGQPSIEDKEFRKAIF